MVVRGGDQTGKGSKTGKYDVCACVCAWVRMRACVRACAWVGVRMRAWVSVHMRAWVGVRMCLCVHTCARVCVVEGWRSLAGEDSGGPRWTTAGERMGKIQLDKGVSLDLKHLPIFQRGYGMVEGFRADFRPV